MPVNIRENERYRAVVKSLMRKNMSGEKHITGIFSMLAKWRSISKEEAKMDLMRAYAMASNPTQRRREIEAVWMRILLTMPKPKYVN